MPQQCQSCPCKLGSDGLTGCPGSCAAGRYFADLVIARLREVLAGMLLAPAPPEQAWLQALPPPMFAGNEAARDAVCLKGEAFRSAAVQAKVLPSLKPCVPLPLLSRQHSIARCTCEQIQCWLVIRTRACCGCSFPLTVPCKLQDAWSCP